MPTTPQLQNRLNPQAFSINVPSTGLFRAVGGGSTLYKREGDKVTKINLVDLLVPDNSERAGIGNFGAQTDVAIERLRGRYGLDFNSLPEVNIADLRTSRASSVPGRKIAPRLLSVEGNFTSRNQSSDINEFLGVSPAQIEEAQQNTQRNFLGATEQPFTIGGENPFTQTSNLQPGDSGAEVEELQNYLVSQGYLTQEQMDTGPGIYGPRTTEAVRQLQESLGVDNTTGPGYFGPRTQQAISQQSQSEPTIPPPTDTTDTSDNAPASDPDDQNALTFDDPDLQDRINQLPLDIRGAVNQLYLFWERMIEGGQILNPDIQFTHERLQEFMDEAQTDIEPYYQEVLGQAKDDIELSLNRLSEDYKREVGRAEEPFKEGLAVQDEAEAQAGLTYGSERVRREGQNIESQQRSLDDVFREVERGVQDTVSVGERTLGSSFLSDLQSPQFSPFTASAGGFQQGQSRTLGGLQGGLLGSIPKQKEVDVRTRASEIEDITRRNRILDLSPL